MIDEIDKMGADFRGDPSSAMLEVLDPEQNEHFRDHYLDLPFDLSRVMFITTANVLEAIPGPLRDRMEVIQLAGYTAEEKHQIAKRYLFPRQIERNGLRPEQITIREEVIDVVIAEYTREAGVRNLERELGAICRKVALEFAESKAKRHVTVTAAKARAMLAAARVLARRGAARASPGSRPASHGPLPAATCCSSRPPTIPAAGKLDHRPARRRDAGVRPGRAVLRPRPRGRAAARPAGGLLPGHDFHVHVPAGAIPKDGPSAGVTMATALSSLLSGRHVRDDTAMTGELTLTGQVLPIGGLKEKALAAQAAGIERVIAPKLNRQDVEDIPKHLMRDLEFIWVERIEEVLANALEPEAAKRNGRPPRRGGPRSSQGAGAPRRPGRAARVSGLGCEQSRLALLDRAAVRARSARTRRRSAGAAGRSFPTSAMSRLNGRPTVQSITARTFRAVPGIWLTW